MNLGQVYTKRNVADFMVNLFTISDGGKALDPCFGGGVFIESLLENSHLDVVGVEIDRISFEKFKNPNVERCRLLNCDFFDIEEEFDGIIMNPPYVRQEEIDEMTELGVTKRKLQSACGLMTISTKANLYMYFILRAILLLKDGGELIAIFPNSWTNTPVGKQFREQIMRYGNITDFINVCGNPFVDSPMVDVCILKFKRGAMGETHFMTMCIKDGDFTVSETFNKEQKKQKGLVKLHTIADIRRGVTTGANKFFVNPPLFTQNHLVGILSSPKDFKGYTTRNCKQDKLLVISSENDANEEELAYLENCALQIQREGKPQTLKKLIENGQNWYSISMPPTAQIIFSYIIRGTIKFALNEGNRNVRDNFYMISGKSENPLLLLALLNNYHVFLQLENCGKTYGKGLLKLQKYDIDAICIPHPNRIEDYDRRRLMEQAKQLVETADENIIASITEVLNFYYGSDNAQRQFESLKQERLSNHE